MEHVIEHKTPVAGWSQPAHYAHAGALPQTDALLSRSMNISIGVVDGGIGSAFGINIHSSASEIEEVAATFINAYKAALSSSAVSREPAPRL